MQIGSGAKLKSVGAIDIATHGKGDIEIDTNADTYGAVGVALAASVVDIRPENVIDVAGDAELTADGDIVMNAAINDDFSRDKYTVTARSDTYAGAVIPINDTDASALLFQTNTIDIHAGAKLFSGGDIKLHAEDAGFADMTAQAKGVNWATSAIASGVNSALGGAENFGGTAHAEAWGLVTVDGELHTGTSATSLSTSPPAARSPSSSISASMTGWRSTDAYDNARGRISRATCTYIGADTRCAD